MKKILVLMATYNGEKYVAQQIDSILAQKDVATDIIISDDCSSDGTVEILKQYHEIYGDRVKYSINEKNKNFTYNFLDMIFSCPDDYEYYSLSDQDDVWLEDKLISAVNAIGERTNPFLYMSALNVTDENLNIITYMNYKNENNPSFDKFKMADGNLCTGCTAVFNRALLYKIREHYPENLHFHDYWIFLIANLVKGCESYFDDNSHILYRQHGNNMVGLEYDNNSQNKTSAAKIKGLFARKPIVGNILNVFYSCYAEDMPNEYRKHIKPLARYMRNPIYKTIILTDKKYTNVHKNAYNVLRVLLNRY